MPGRANGEVVPQDEVLRKARTIQNGIFRPEYRGFAQAEMEVGQEGCSFGVGADQQPPGTDWVFCRAFSYEQAEWGTEQFWRKVERR